MMNKLSFFYLNCIITVWFAFISINLFSQQSATGSGNTTLPPSLPNSSFSWFRGGNFAGGAAGTNNLFGTQWNSPIYTITNGNVRMITMGGGIGVNDGRIVIGNNLAGNFQPVNRFHLHQNGIGTYGIQFTNSTTSAIPFAPTATEGFAMNYTNVGIFQFQQFNNRNVQTTFERKFHHATYVKSHSLPCPFVL